MGILDRFKKTDLDLDIDEDALLREALGHKVKKKIKRSSVIRKVKSKKSAPVKKTKSKKAKPAKVTVKIHTSAEKSLIKRIWELEKQNRFLVKELNNLRFDTKHEVSNIKDEIRQMNEVFSPGVVRTINANMNILTKQVKEIERDESNTLKSVISVDKRIGTIERRALEVESDYRHAKVSADELQKKAEDLKHTARLFMSQMDQFHSKTNAEFSKIVDMERQLESVQQRLSMTEDVKMNANSMENAINENARIISEIARKLEHFERTSRRTIVLD